MIAFDAFVGAIVKRNDALLATLHSFPSFDVNGNDLRKSVFFAQIVENYHLQYCRKTELPQNVRLGARDL